MILPTKMTLLTLHINPAMIPIFLNDIIQVKNFHILDEKKGSTGHSGLIQSDQYDKLNDQMSAIQNQINEIIEEIKLKPENIPALDNRDERLTFEFNTAEDFINDLQAKTEDIYLKLKRISENLLNIDLRLEEIAKIVSLLNIISKFGGEKYSNNDFKRLKFELFTTSIEQFKEISMAIDYLNSPIVFYGEKIGPEIMGFFVFFEEEHTEQMSNLFLTYNCQKIEIPEKYMDSTGILMENLEKDHESMVNRRKTLSKAYEDYVAEIPIKIMGYFETLENAEILLNLVKQIRLTPSHNIVEIKGFVPMNIENDLIKALKDQFKSNIKIESQVFERTDPYEEEEPESKHKEKIKPPTFLKLNWLAKPFKGLVDLYGTTNYSEIDPSIFLAFTFPLLFGLMFGDAGHGLVLVLFGLIFWIKFKKSNPGMAQFMLLLLFCGLGAILGGFMYGEFFGGHLIFLGHEIVLFHNPIENIVMIIKMSVVIGVGMLTLGYIIRALNLIINRRIFLALTEPLVKVWILIGGTILMLELPFDITAWFSPPEPILLVIIPSLVFIIIKPIGKLFRISYMKEKSVAGLIGESVMDFMETMLQIISNVASFVRILALEMAHIGLMIVISEIMGIVNVEGFFGTYVVLPLIQIAGNAFVIVLELILVIIHDMRLHFYEFFSKFYMADGTVFKPITISEQFSEIHFKELKNIDSCFEFYCED